MRDISIYDGKRLAQPDEVANFQTGDGVEKAFLLANVIRERGLGEDIELVVERVSAFLAELASSEIDEYFPHEPK